MNKIKHFAFLALVGASSGLLGGTATKEYVDRRDLTIAVAATNYTDAAVAAVGGVTREVVTNIAEYVTGTATNGLPEAIAAKYTLPTNGIPAGDIAAGVIPFFPDVTLVWTNNAVQTKDGEKAIGATEVGARADTWMPSAADVGALAVTPDDYNTINWSDDQLQIFSDGNTFTFRDGIFQVPFWSDIMDSGNENLASVLSSKFDNSKTNDLLSVAMSASESYLVTSNATETWTSPVASSIWGEVKILKSTVGTANAALERILNGEDE